MAGDRFDFTISGGEDIEKMLRDISDAHQKRALQHSFRAGAKIIVNQAKSNAKSKQLPARVVKGFKIVNRQSNLSVVEIKFKNTGSSRGAVAERSLTTPALASVFEFGTKDRIQKKTGRETGRITARPFMRPAVDSKKEEAINVIKKITTENIQIIKRQVASRQKISLAKKNRDL